MRKLTRATVCPCSCSAVCDVPRCQVARALVVDAARRKLTSLMHRSCGKQAVSRDAVLKAFKSLGSLTASTSLTVFSYGAPVSALSAFASLGSLTALTSLEVCLS